MAVQLNHTIVPARDKTAAAEFIAEILGLDPPKAFGPFMCVETANGVSLDYDDRWEVSSHHYAFLVRGGVRRHLLEVAGSRPGLLGGPRAPAAQRDQ